MSYFHEFKHLIDECNNDLIQGAIRTDKTVERVANIARDDVAGIRSTTSSNSKRSEEEEEEEEEVELECDFPMRCVNLTSSTKTKYNHRDDVDHLFFVEAAQTLKVDVKDSKTRYEAAKVTKSYREKNPVNEFLTGDEGLVKAHVDVFLLGTAFDKKHVSPHLTAQQRNHLLMQFTTNAASCICLIFHLFDQMQRHSSIRSVHAKTMNMQKFQGFVKEVTSDDFQVKLRNAVANPSSPDGRYVMKKLVPMLASAGRTTTFGALERDRSKGEILALGRRFGCAPTFLTFAIDDVNSTPSIRLITPSSNNADFPCRLPGEVHEALRNDFPTEGYIKIPKTYYERYARLTENPVGAALVYKKFVEDVLTILVGRNPYSKRTGCVWDDESIGIAGTNIASFGKTETTGRGSLHFHVVLWGGISPDFLELMSDIPELCKKIGSILKSMYSASLTRDQHASDLATKELRKRFKKNPFLRLPPSRAMQIPPDPYEKLDFRSFVSETLCHCNGIHNHSFTCHKGTMGYSGCRLCKPSGLRKETLPVILEVDEDKEAKEYAYKDPPSETIPQRYIVDKERHPSQNLYPVSSSEPRTIVWEMERPEEKPLNPLPKAMGDKTREYILQRLYQQMLPKSVDGDEVLYDPPKDENCLFHVLLKGLERSKPDIAKGMTTKSLRGDLMEHLALLSNEKKKHRLRGKSYSLENLAKLQKNKRESSQEPTQPQQTTSKFDIKGYIKEMRDDTPYKCKRGGCLEYYLFAEKYEVNVGINSEGDIDGNITDLQYGVFIGDTKPTIHLSYDEEHYKLFRIEWPITPEEKDRDRKKTPEAREKVRAYKKDGIIEEHRTKWTAKQVDLYNFVQDNNNLFHSLLKGLNIVHPPSILTPNNSSKQSLRGLKRDLMKYLKDNSHRAFVPSNNKASTLEKEVIRRLSTTKTPNVENHSPIERYAQLIQDDELGGDELEMQLFANSKNVNVLVYQHEKDSFVRLHEYFAPDKDSAETIHLLVNRRDDSPGGNDSNQDDASSQDGVNISDSSPDGKGTGGNRTYTLFMPKLYSIMRVLQSVEDVVTLRNIYTKISDKIQGRNGFVVDYSPLLTSLLGCNTNLLFLGAKEQSRGALFYIGPYINKNGVEIIDALPLMVSAQEEVLLFPSVAEDSDTTKRTVQHVLTRTLNKLNSQMEISDTQAAGALMCLSARMTSESFSYLDFNGYKNFIFDSILENRKRKRVEDAREWCNETGVHQVTCEMEEIEDESSFDEESDEERTIDGDDDVDDDDDDTGVDTGSLRGDFESDSDGDEKESVVLDANDLWKDWEDECCERFDMQHNKGSYGSAKIYNVGQDKRTGDEIFHAITYPELYRYRGKELKMLNRLEYSALVKVVSGRDIFTGEAKRKKSKQYSFGKGLIEKIGPKYYQILRSKQCTPRFFCKLPPPPGKKPSDASKVRRWRKRANQFAFHYLTLFRAEEDLYESGQDCNYQYNWEAFIDFESQLRCSDRAIDHSRLEQMDRMIHGWKVNTARRMMLAKYRGRKRTEWSAQQKELARVNRIKAMENHADSLDYEPSSMLHKDLSKAQKTKNSQINDHKNECATILTSCMSEGECSQSGCVDPKYSRTTLPLRDEWYMNLKTALPEDKRRDDSRRSGPFPVSMNKKVNRYLKKQDLSSDKDQAVKLLRDHFTAIYEGASEDEDYEAPYLLICGGPGNGKSKLVETFDGMSERMDVGRIVKTAFVGGAAVNIGGSSLLGLFDIPVIEKGDGSEEGMMSRIIPWSDEKRKDFRKKYPNYIIK